MAPFKNDVILSFPLHRNLRWYFEIEIKTKPDLIQNLFLVKKSQFGKLIPTLSL